MFIYLFLLFTRKNTLVCFFSLCLYSAKISFLKLEKMYEGDCTPPAPPESMNQLETSILVYYLTK